MKCQKCNKEITDNNKFCSHCGAPITPTPSNNKYTQERETEIVKDAMNLTATIEFENSELSKLKTQRFPELQSPPVRQVISQPRPVQPQYPKKPKVNYTYVDYLKEQLNIATKKTSEATSSVQKNKFIRNICIIAVVILSFTIIGQIIGVFLGVFAILGLCAYLAVSIVPYSKKLSAKNNELANSPEYLRAVAEAENLANEQQRQVEANLRVEQAKLDKEYSIKKEHYEKVTVPEYNKAFSIWKENQSIKISVLEEEIKLNEEVLEKLYEATRIISASYRQLWILRWLYLDMSTSDHDIRYATELLDRDRQRLATERAGQLVRESICQMENTMMKGFHAIYNAIENGNELQMETIDLLSKTRRDINIGNIVGATQRYKTNKTLENMRKKKK